MGHPDTSREAYRAWCEETGWYVSYQRWVESRLAGWRAEAADALDDD